MSLVFLVSVALLAQPALAQGPVTAQDNQGVADPGTQQGVPMADIIFVPDDAAHAVCPPFGACPPADQVTTEYIGFGVDFSVFDGNPPVGVFTDPPDKFGGVNGAGDLDLITDTCGRIVATGSTAQATTDLVVIEAGFVGGPNDILLEVYDLGGSMIGSAILDNAATFLASSTSPPCQAHFNPTTSSASRCKTCLACSLRSSVEGISRSTK